MGLGLRASVEPGDGIMRLRADGVGRCVCLCWMDENRVMEYGNGMTIRQHCVPNALSFAIDIR